MGWKDAAARSFADPPSAYGAIDGWWWEAGRLDEERMRWQLQELKDKGVAGSWFYARYVYDEPLASDPRYFTDGWWDFTRFAAAEQQRLGLQNYTSVWTQLELEQDAIRAQRDAEPQLWGRRLAIHRVRSEVAGPLALELPDGDEPLDAAAWRADGEALDPASRVALGDAVRDGRVEWEAPEAGWQLTVVAARPWDLDYLDAEIGERWIDVVLGEYERRMGDALGESVQGFGPDEMRLLNGSTLFSAPLLEDVRERLGEDPRPLLAGLFHDVGAATDRIRCAWYDAMCARLSEVFYEAPARWLHERGMDHATISQLGDDPLTHTFHYGDFLRYMRSFDIPGNEDPGDARPGERRLLQTKISSSLARLGAGAGGGRAVVLAHYCAGWGHTLEENLAWTTEAYAKGMNLYSRHLASYSLMGGWYEYVPPSDHFYHPYWRYWRTFADWVRRLSFLMSQGKHRADVALLYPTSTIHAHWVAGREREGSDGYAPQVPDAAAEPHHPGDIGNIFVELEDGPDLKAFFDPPAHDASQGMIALAEAIYRDGIDFDVVDAATLARATVRGDVLEIDGVELRCVLLPPCTTLPLATMELAKAFYDAGGCVGAHGRLPDASVEHGRGDPALRALVEHVFGSDAFGATAPLTRRNDAGGSAFFVPGKAAAVPAAISEAIVRDVEVDDGGVFHSHQHVDGDEVYLLFNTEERERELTVRLRVDADVEAWDPFDGSTRPLHRVRRGGGVTEVALTLGVYGGVVLVCSPGTTRPAVVEDDLTEVTAVEPAPEDVVALEGFAAEGGVKRARVVHDGGVYAGEAEVDAPPAPLALDGPFAFRLEPTMDNRWGDFRHPPSPTTIGAEARRFRHRVEDDVPGTELGWHAAEHDDAAWDEVQFSHGPYWRQLGPFAPGAEPDDVLARALAGDARLAWQPYELSQQFGSQRQSVGWKGAEHLVGVSENFLILDGPPGGHHYLATTVVAPEKTERLFVFGRQRDHDMVSVPVADREPFTYRVPAGTRLWIDGAEVALPLDDAGAGIAVRVKLRGGPNQVLLRLVQPDEGRLLNYAAFVRALPWDADPYVPRLRWFAEPQDLVYDVAPECAEPVAWYRFTAPPGVRRMRLDVRCRGVEAWVGGQPVAVADDGAIALDAAAAGPVAVALRVRQEAGAYGGAAFAQPVAFDCEDGAIALGDWSAQGLATYSGVGVYATDVELTAEQLRHRAVLDLGMVKTVAEVLVNGEPAGVRIARPFRFDVGALLREGANRIEVKVANTLANHMSTYPTMWVFEGQTTSGLLGPVELRFAAPVRLTARRVGDGTRER